MKNPFRVAARRVSTVAAIGLVLALAILAACPKLHTWLHGQHNVSGADTCAVALFAGGVPLQPGTTAPIPPAVSGQAVRAITTAEIFVPALRYLRHPKRGPPAGA